MSYASDLFIITLVLTYTHTQNLEVGYGWEILTEWMITLSCPYGASILLETRNCFDSRRLQPLLREVLLQHFEIRFVFNSHLALLSDLLGAWTHCVEEMMCLKGFLPDFYRAETARRAQLAPFESRMNVDNIISIADIYS